MRWRRRRRRCRPQLEAMVAHARRRHDAHVAAAAARLRRGGGRCAACRAASRRGSRASAPTSCAGPGPSFRADPFPLSGPSRARVSRPRRFPLARRAGGRDRGDQRRFRAGDGGRARRARPLYPISGRRAAQAMGRAQPQQGLDRDPPRPERRHDRGQCPPLPSGDGAARLARAAARSAGAGPMRCSRCSRPAPHIPPHTGVANTRLVCHLPLDRARRAAGSGSATRRATWEVGKAWIFDDTIEHEALNPTRALRVILIVDTWHPDLGAAEREAVAAMHGGDRSRRRDGGAVNERPSPPRPRRACCRAANPGDADQVFRAVLAAINAGPGGAGAAARSRPARRAIPSDARMWQMLGLVHRKLDDLAPSRGCARPGGGARAGGRPASPTAMRARDAGSGPARASICSSAHWRCAADGRGGAARPGRGPVRRRPDRRRDRATSRRSWGQSGLAARPCLDRAAALACAASARPSPPSFEAALPTAPADRRACGAS